MQRIVTAFRAMWLILCGGVTVEAARCLLLGSASTDEQPTARTTPAGSPAAARSEALSLLATLQREARFVDLVQEQLEHYEDAQVGAAARDVLRDCRAALERMFQLEPILDQEEGSELTTDESVDGGVWQLTGKVSGSPPYRGRLVHHGWRAHRVELPVWSGSEASQNVVAPVEIEVS